jgi:hypothetical protein
MINSQHRRALSIPTRRRIAASHSQAHRWTVRYIGSTVNSYGATT